MRTLESTSDSESCKQPSELRLNLSLKDFGPISRANIDLKPFTIFIGPNNSGKSYAATLIHSLFDTYNPLRIVGPVPILERPPLFFINFLRREAVRADFRDIRIQIERLSEGVEMNVGPDRLDSLATEVRAGLLEQRFSEHICAAYACPLSELVREGKRTFEIGIGFDSFETLLGYQHSEKRLKIKQTWRFGGRLEIRVLEAPETQIQIEPADWGILVTVRGPFAQPELPRSVTGRLTDWLLETVSFSSSALLKLAFYLPAQKSGLFQVYQTLAARMIEGIKFSSLLSSQNPKLSAPALDFIRDLLEASRNDGPLAAVSREFEKKMIDGELAIRGGDGTEQPAITYSHQGANVPFHRASSSVTELAPLFVYLRRYIEPGCVLIFDEPEAHLHPANIRNVARLLVRLRREGVNLIITTHSEYLLEQLSNFVLMEKIAANQRVERYRYGKDDFLKPDEVGVHLFKYDKRSKGYTTKALEVSADEGISEEGFMAVHDELYDESVKLERDLIKERQAR